MKALKWQLMQSKLSENFGKWRPYLELFWGPQGGGGRNFTGGGTVTPMEPTLQAIHVLWNLLLTGEKLASS